MDFLKYIKRAFQIALLDKKVIRKVAEDKNALIPGLIFLVLGSFVAVYVQYVYRKAPLSLQVYIPIFVLTVLVMIGLVHLLARLFGSKEKVISFLRPTLVSSLFSILGLASLIPFIGPILHVLISIWSLVIFVIVIKESYKLSTGKAIGIMLLMLLAVLVAIVIIGIVIGITMVAQNPALYMPK